MTRIFSSLAWAGVVFMSWGCWAQSEVEAQCRSDWSDEVLYFVILDRFADGDPGNNENVDIGGKGTFHGGDLRGLTQQLDELKQLGVSAVWFTPIVDNIDDYTDAIGFPDWAYHGYWADDFERLDSRFGSESDLRLLVERAHGYGIKLLMDVVYNHSGYGSQFTTRPDAKQWVRMRSECGEDDLTMCLSGLPDFKTERREVADYLLNANLRWAQQFELDGFRLDTVKHVSHRFWSRHREMVRSMVKRPFFLLGEVWGGDRQVLDPWFENNELDAGFDFSFSGNVEGFVEGRGRTIAFSRYLMKRHQIREGYLVAHYLSTHDVPGLLFKLKGDKAKFRLCALLQMTSIGIPVIYYGEEVGRMGGDWPDNRSDMPWGESDVMPGKGKARDEQMLESYQQLIAIRRANPALWRGSYEEISTDGDLLVFGRIDASSGNRVWVAANRGNQAATVQLEWGGPDLSIVYGQGEVRLEGDSLQLHIPPVSGVVLKPKNEE